MRFFSPSPNDFGNLFFFLAGLLELNGFWIELWSFNKLQEKVSQALPQASRNTSFRDGVGRRLKNGLVGKIDAFSESCKKRRCSFVLWKHQLVGKFEKIFVFFCWNVSIFGGFELSFSLLVLLSSQWFFTYLSSATLQKLEAFTPYFNGLVLFSHGDVVK